MQIPSSSRMAEAEVSPCVFLAKMEYSPASSAKVMEISNLHSPVSFLYATLYLMAKKTQVICQQEIKTDAMYLNICADRDVKISQKLLEL